jgi:predicted Zn-dependent protease
MSEWDKKDPEAPPGDGEFSWESTLEEWKEEVSARNLAPDEDTKKPAISSGTSVDRLSRPLYRPPTSPGTGPLRAAPPPRVAAARRSLPPRPAPSPGRPPPPRPAPPPPVEEPTWSDSAIDVEMLASDLSPEPDPIAAAPDLVQTPPPPASKRAPDPGRGLAQVFDQPGAAFDADDEEVDALLGGPTLYPPSPEAVTQTFEQVDAQRRASSQPVKKPSAVDFRVMDDETLDSEPTRPIEAFALLPKEREHDPDAETSIAQRPLTREAIAQLIAPPPSTVPPAEPAQPREAIPDGVPIYGTESVLAALRTRADWLEDEAAARSGANRAHLLLTLSEIRAMLGEHSRATQLATSARNAAPGLLLAHKQARALSGAPRSHLAAMLKNEADASLAPAARLHSILLAADALRASGDEVDALRVWTELASAVPDDPRALVACAALGLARGEVEAVAKLTVSPGAQPIRDGILAALALRGAAPDRLPAEGAFAHVKANDALRRARAAFAANDMVTAAFCIAELREVPELSRPAGWLFAALGCAEPEARRAAAAALEELIKEGEEPARRSLAACAVELSDVKLAQTAIEGGAFSSADRAVLRTLLDIDVPGRERDAEALSSAEAMAPLAAAVAALVPPRAPRIEGDPPSSERGRIERRTDRLSGTAHSRAERRLARLLAADAPADIIELALASLEDPALPEARGIALELEARLGRWTRVADALQAWPPSAQHGHVGDGPLAAALVAERAGELELARQAYQAARSEDPGNEGIARALAALDPTTDLSEQLSGLADELGDGVAGALARLEAAMRADGVDDAARADLLERTHRAAPALPMAAFLARRSARQKKDTSELLRWIAEERTADTDPLEHAVGAVRQAVLLEGTDPVSAGERAAEAHRARPDDMALRELYERLSLEPPPDQGAWREQRAAHSKGDARAMLYMEAAHKYERQGDRTSALRAAEAAVLSGDSMLAKLALERAELEAGAAARLADVLLTQARETESVEERREAYERLADLDAVGRSDPASALLWHRSILEESPTHKASLRYLEHAFLGDGRDEELEPIATAVARALDGTAGNEGVAHADFAARLCSRGPAGNWDATLEVAEIAARQPVPSLSSQRLLNAHGRSRRDDALVVKTTLALVAKATRPAERAALLLRAGEAASRLGDLVQATDLLERAKAEDPGDLVVWGLLASVRRRAGDPKGAAEAYEALARLSLVPEHRLSAWYDAARSWLDDAHEDDRELAALEQAAAIDVTYEDVFRRLSALHTARGAKGELAALLERRIATITDPEERVAMEVERGRALAEVGDNAGARKALLAALASQPDSTSALAHFAELAAREEDWEAAEQAWVRLGRLFQSADEQRAVYARLGELYLTHSVNLPRAELAFKEVLKRAPGDVTTLERLVEVYRGQNDAPHAVEVAQQLVLLARDPSEKRARLIELAGLHESPGHDTRKAEQALEGARREFPTDVTVLRALAEFYIRHKQMPAVHMLLDRAAADARRAFAAGRFSPALFEVMRTVFELRGRKDAARIVGATLAAFDGKPANVRGAEGRALDPTLDDKLAPELLTPALRTLLKSAGAALDAAAPVDLRALQATPLGPSNASAHKMIQALVAAAGLPAPTVYVSASLGRACVPASSEPPTLVIGAALLSVAQDGLVDDGARTFMIVRAIKLIATHASALVRTPSADLGVLVSAWLQAFNPNWTPQGVNPAALAAALKKVAPSIPKKLPPELGMLALEVAGSLGLRASTLGAMALSWANRAALLAIGDPSAALQAIAWGHGARDGAPLDPEERTSWLARTHEAKDLMTFSISDAYAEARERLGLDTDGTPAALPRRGQHE